MSRRHDTAADERDAVKDWARRKQNTWLEAPAQAVLKSLLRYLGSRAKRCDKKPGGIGK